MISKFLSKLKSILFKSAVTPETSLKKEKKAAKSAKIPDLDTCLLNLLRADSIPSFSPTVTCVKIF